MNPYIFRIYFWGYGVNLNMFKIELDDLGDAVLDGYYFI